MRRPAGLWQQYEGKAKAELARGCGQWPAQVHPCALEPPWTAYDREAVTVWDCLVNGWEGAWQGSWLGRLLARPLYQEGEPLILPRAPWADTEEDLVPVLVEQFPGDGGTIPMAELLLRALPGVCRPVAFEVIGLGPQPRWDPDKFRELARAKADPSGAITGWVEPAITVQFVAHRHDAALLRSQLLAHYPNSAVVQGTALDYHRDLMPAWDLNAGRGFAVSAALGVSYCFPLRTFTRLEPDPLGVALAVLERLGREEWALLQVLFEPALHPWEQNVRRAAEDPYQPGRSCFNDLSERLLSEKFSGPLYAVSVRLAAKRQRVLRQLLGWAEQFAAPPPQLMYLEGYAEDLPRSLEARCTFRPGMLLNVQELAALVHLPAAPVASERLRKVKTRTRPVAATPNEAGSVLLGENIHQGRKRLARIPPALRSRHCYVAGASGTGKSTLLLRMIVQDLVAGQGVGVLDPHGDLIKAVLQRIPANRIDDVVLFDPSDRQHPFALNILEAKGAAERERIVAEMVMALERFFPTSWGPRLERILIYTIHTVLQAIPGATLADVERVLTDEAFRRGVIANTTDARLVQFWKTQFVHMPKNAVDPVLNKLSPFLLNETVRNIICQRHSSVDFDQLLNQGKVLLANLSAGLLTEKIAGMFGSFLITKIVNAAFRRASLPEEQRRPWYLYVDEFQAFMNLSVGFDRILAEARKYQLVLAGLANQYVGQLTPQVRQAVFGNVGTLIVFRLGVEDAQIAARELGTFTAEEILNLERGQAIVRAGSSSTAFNLRTYPEPPVAGADPTARIVGLSRSRYARPLRDVEQEIGDVDDMTQRLEGATQHSEEPADLSEDDLVK